MKETKADPITSITDKFQALLLRLGTCVQMEDVNKTQDVDVKEMERTALEIYWKINRIAFVLQRVGSQWVANYNVPAHAARALNRINSEIADGISAKQSPTASMNLALDRVRRFAEYCETEANPITHIVRGFQRTLANTSRTFTPPVILEILNPVPSLIPVAYENFQTALDLRARADDTCRRIKEECGDHLPEDSEKRVNRALAYVNAFKECCLEKMKPPPEQPKDFCWPMMPMPAMFGSLRA
ncbi:MAG: hypothetical protein P4M13_05370 [Alphaproteobacteria bacterium]|nr:hypothetical protein [Alphaproteobacteria bacterium]